MEGPDVLLIEDDEELRHLMAEVLRNGGCQVIEARDGREAIELLETMLREDLRPPDVIVTEGRLDGWTGFEIVEGLHGSYWERPSIVLVATEDGDGHEQAARCGAGAVIDKPFDLGELLTAYVQLTGSSRFYH
jgi:CheY-like chemotaxis protein